MSFAKEAAAKVKLPKPTKQLSLFGGNDVKVTVEKPKLKRGKSQFGWLQGLNAPRHPKAPKE